MKFSITLTSHLNTQILTFGHLDGSNEFFASLKTKANRELGMKSFGLMFWNSKEAVEENRKVVKLIFQSYLEWKIEEIEMMDKVGNFAAFVLNNMNYKNQ